MKDLNNKIKQLEEKRLKAQTIYSQQNKQINDQSYRAYNQNLREIESRIKTQTEEEFKQESQLFKQFKNYMHKQEKKREQLKSQELVEQDKAITQLSELEKKLKIKKDIQNLKVLETAHKA